MAESTEIQLTEIVGLYWDELQRSLDLLSDDLKGVFSELTNWRNWTSSSVIYPYFPKWFDVLVDDGLNAFQNFGQRVATIPGRMAVRIAAVKFSVPSHFHHKVIALDDAIKLAPLLFSHAMLEAKVLAHGAPGLVLKKKVSHWVNLWKFWRYFDLSAAAKLVKGRIITTILHLMALVLNYAGLMFAVFLFWLIWKFVNDDRNRKAIESFSMFQGNPLVHDKTLGRKRDRGLKP